MNESYITHPTLTTRNGVVTDTDKIANMNNVVVDRQRLLDILKDNK